MRKASIYIVLLFLCSSWSPFGPKPLERATSISLATRDHLNDPSTLSKLTHSIPDTTRKTGLTSCISRMMGQQAGANEKSLVVTRQRKAIDINDGIGGDPIFFVRSGGALPRYVVKAYRDEQKLACELSAFDLLAHLSLKRARVPSLTAVGRAAVAEGRYSLLAYDYLPGLPVTALFQRVGEAEGFQVRKEAFMGVERAIRSIGSALAELHGSKVEVSREQASYFVKKEERLLTKFLAAVKRHPEVMATSQEEFIKLFCRLQEGRSRAAWCHTYAHLDPHLGNWLYDDPSQTLSMIDLQTLHYSVGAGGKPLASPWLDYLVVYFSLEGMGNLYHLSCAEIARLREVFHLAYAQESSLPLPSADELMFYSLYYWMKMVSVFDRPAASDSASISCQKEQMVTWGMRGLAECLENLIADNPHCENQEDREYKAPSGQWVVGL